MIHRFPSETLSFTSLMGIVIIRESLGQSNTLSVVMRQCERGRKGSLSDKNEKPVEASKSY